MNLNTCCCYGTCHKKLHEIQRIPRKFCTDSVKFSAANCEIAVLLPQRVSPISAERYLAVCGMLLRCPWICPYKVTSSFFVERLYCIRIWHTSFALVATHVRYTLWSLFKPSPLGMLSIWDMGGSRRECQTNDDSMDNLWWFHGYPWRCCEKNCRLLMRWIRRVHKVACDVYHSYVA